jgi:hypothetical protein
MRRRFNWAVLIVVPVIIMLFTVALAGVTFLIALIKGAFHG